MLEVFRKLNESVRHFTRYIYIYTNTAYKKIQKKKFQKKCQQLTLILSIYSLPTYTYNMRFTPFLTSSAQVHRAQGSDAYTIISLKRKTLFSMLASNNLIMTDVIIKLRLLDADRPGATSWKAERYGSVYEGLREEFDLDRRFRNLDFKLDHVKEENKFFYMQY